MTAFMQRIATMVGSDTVPEPIPMPTTRISERIATGTGADRQVAVRSMAEQLVSEANAVLDQSDDRLALIDETLPSELAFEMVYRGRAARVSTTFANGTAYGLLVGAVGVSGGTAEQDREIAEAGAGAVG